jgi:hypothetical protein
MRKLFSICFFCCLFPVFLYSQEEDINHTELGWHTLETEHFIVNFQDSTERTAREIAYIAEQVYKPITDLYHHEPDQKVNFVICDYDDYSNGGAAFLENRIIIWASALDYEFRGTHPWLWDVISHEFTHIIQVQTSLKFGRKLPAFYLQWLGYESERRPDVLYGYPNVMVSYPISGFMVPPWFAEGTAQYNNPNFNYDFWDTHRDMILRMYMLEDKPLSWEEMGYFPRNGLGNESVYNSGFSLVQYIGRKYGKEKLEDISRHLGDCSRLTMDGACEAALHKTGKEVYGQWKEEKEKEYRSVAASLQGYLTKSRILEPEGFGSLSSAFSPDGKTLAYISSKEMPSLALTSLYLYDFKNGTSKLLMPVVHSSVSFSPEGTFLYYAKITRDNRHWSALSDIYRYNLRKEKEERLTWGLRAINPKLSSNGKSIAFASGKDGTMNLGICDAAGKNIRWLTRYKNGEQVYTPVWSPDGKKIAFGYSFQHNQSIALIDSNGSNFKFLTKQADARDPFFSPDGSELYFSWDRTGIFNVYARSLTSDSCRQITNVLGGAFLPDVDSAGRVVYAEYQSSGYKLALLSDSAVFQKGFTAGQPVSNRFADSLNAAQTMSHPILPDTVKNYHSKFTSLMLMPFLRVDTYNEHNTGVDALKPGMYFLSEEVLGKIVLSGGFATNRRWESDIFLTLEYHDRFPILYQLGLEPTFVAELYNITRKIDYGFDLFIDELQHFNATVSYNLSEYDFSLRQPIFDETNLLTLQCSLSKYNQDFGSWVHPKLGVISASRSTYLVSTILSCKISHDGILPGPDASINPVGRKISLKYSYESNNYNPNDSLDTSKGTWVPIYTPIHVNRLEFTWNEHIPLPIKRQTLSLRLTTGFIFGPTVDDFFDFYEGGFIGMQGYPFYAIGGNEATVLNMTYRFPLLQNIDGRVGPIYFTKLFGSVFGDIGNAWNHEIPNLPDWKKDAGFELRLEGHSWYEFPTCIFFSGAYGFDRFTKAVQSTTTTYVTYGKEWRFYFGVLFDFDLNGFAKSMRLH